MSHRSIRDRLAHFIKRGQRQIDLCEAGDEDALWRAGFLNLTTISIVVILFVALLLWCL